jgi:hypothetical protein
MAVFFLVVFLRNVGRASTAYSERFHHAYSI